MKYTKEQLSGIGKTAIGKQLDILTGMYCEDAFGKFMPTLDIDNPNDIMPLAFEHGISLISPESNGTEDWSAEKFVSNGFNNTTVYHDKNPLRAIACCLILVLQDKARL